MDRRLYRSRSDRVIGGVSGGLAVYLRIDPSLVRVAWVILAFATGGFFVLVYLAMLFIVPEEPYPGAALASAGPLPVDDAGGPTGEPRPFVGGEAEATGGGAPPSARWWEETRSGSGGVILGLILVLVGAYFLLRQYIPQIDLDVIWPAVVIVIGVLLLVGALRPGGRRG